VTYVELIRGTPLLVQIFIVYFFIGTVLNLDRFTAGVAALAVFTGAYVAEIVRAGISSIHKGQMEAGRSLGMTSAQTMRYVILPQAFKRVLPPLAGQFINLIKDSSLVSVISITDLTKAGREVVSSTFSPFEVWFTVALLYLVLTGTLLPGASSGGEICAQQLIPLSRHHLCRSSAIISLPLPGASSGGEICAQQLIPLSKQAV
jgi:polar amino acid transport system permease protein